MILQKKLTSSDLGYYFVDIYLVDSSNLENRYKLKIDIREDYNIQQFNKSHILAIPPKIPTIELKDIISANITSVNKYGLMKIDFNATMQTDL